MEELRLDGQVAVITGAGRGLGREHALLLAARGARVLVNDPGVELDGSGGDATPAAEVVDLIRARGGEAEVNLDPVGTVEAGEALIAQALERWGRIDILVNNAGIFTDRYPFLDTTQESFERVLLVHLYGTINCTRAAWPHMAARGYGKVINTTSAVGFVGSVGRMEYGVAKGGIHAFTRTLSLDSLDSGIYVNEISPGAGTRPVSASSEFFTDELLAKFSPHLVSPTVLWLAHPDTTVNGETFTAIAGTTAQVVIGEAHGFGSDEPSPESIRDHADEVFLDEKVYAAGLVRHNEADGQGQVLIARFGNRV
ncbi:MAG: short-chain dehydrogenase [Marmoricola sp.]|nr:short-chain dehydrogenase [Marmoricola sp.]